MEGLGVTYFSDVYRGRSVLITGHTGFKGSWLSLWLQHLEAQVTGMALPVDTGNPHWDLLNLSVTDCRGDIRHLDQLCGVVRRARPEIVFHLAAQPLVRHSYRQPVDTWATNVLGTLNLLEACREVGTVRAIVAVTSDKVYANRGWCWGYRERDRLGGHDPYSASKAACEILLESYRQAFWGAPGSPRLASARAGNVIGGGDWGHDRLVPDAIRAVASQQILVIRAPNATRAWQHVLDCLSGYLLLGQKLLEGRRDCIDAWNFGSGGNVTCTVEDLLTRVRAFWPALTWELAQSAQPHEFNALALDDTKARTLLGWRPLWNLDESVRATGAWYAEFLETGRAISSRQLAQYLHDARQSGALWADS